MSAPSQGPARHVATPRTLLFLEWDGRVLLLRGGPTKWFHGRLNGLGGSVERGEDVHAAAVREAREETGLHPSALRLVGVAHVLVEPAVLLFVFHGRLPDGALRPTDEGEHVWLSIDALDDPPPELLEDVAQLLPRALSSADAAAPFSCTIEPGSGGSGGSATVRFSDTA